MVRQLNTPKSGPISQLIKRTTGWYDATNSWSDGSSYVNTFVALRGDFAHQGSNARYIRINTLRDNYRVGVFNDAACDYLNEKTTRDRP